MAIETESGRSIRFGITTYLKSSSNIFRSRRSNFEFTISLALSNANEFYALHDLLVAFPALTFKENHK